MSRVLFLLLGFAFVTSVTAAEPRDLSPLPPRTWTKLTPLATAPSSPRLGYEGACVWDATHQRLVRYGGHNQGGGGEQNSEVWTLDPLTARWELKEPNTSPPGICCGQQNVFDPVIERYVRFPAFSASHGWQWLREVYLNDASVWTYDLATNTWRNMRPLPAPRPRPLRCASFDSEHGVTVVFGGEGSHDGTWTYDAWSNSWKKLSPALEPAPRSGGNLAYDAKNKVHVLFGSQFDDDRHTWTYDLASNTWRDMQPAELPPTHQNDAVLTYDPVAERVLAVVKVTTGTDDEAQHRLETWAYDTAANRWSALKPAREPDPTASRARQLVFAPQLGVALLENRPSNTRGPAEQQIWAYRFAESKPMEPKKVKTKTSPRAVEDVIVSVLAEKEVEVTWKEVAGAREYLVERAPVVVWSDDQLKRLKAQTPPLASPSVAALRWIGPFRQLTKSPVAEQRFLDREVDLTVPCVSDGEGVYSKEFPKEEVDAEGRAYRWGVYAYRVRAIGKDGETAGPSPAVLTIPSSPQHVFSKEAGTTCALQWQANSERGIVGYRVYRMDGRFSQESIPRLTDAPRTETTFEDAGAGKATRRYYVVAVDTLGQEGFPSSPTWFEREWKPFYMPFTGEWHQ